MAAALSDSDAQPLTPEQLEDAAGIARQGAATACWNDAGGICQRSPPITTLRD